MTRIASIGMLFLMGCGEAIAPAFSDADPSQLDGGPTDDAIVAPDLISSDSLAPDLRSPTDLSRLPDLINPSDLATPPDMACPSCDDGDSCTRDYCSQGQCFHDSSNSAGRTCYLGTVAGTCAGGACCTGCLDGQTCRGGTTDATCGGYGRSCQTCATTACVVETCQSISGNHFCSFVPEPTGKACPGGTCISGSCLGCGNAGQSCCNGTQCNGSLSCTSGTCVGCGEAGQACCGGGICNNASLGCTAGGVCQPCGSKGGPCCNGSACVGPNCCSSAHLGCSAKACTCGYSGGPACDDGGGAYHCVGNTGLETADNCAQAGVPYFQPCCL